MLISKIWQLHKNERSKLNATVALLLENSSLLKIEAGPSGMDPSSGRDSSGHQQDSEEQFSFEWIFLAFC